MMNKKVTLNFILAFCFWNLCLADNSTKAFPTDKANPYGGCSTALDIEGSSTSLPVISGAITGPPPLVHRTHAFYENILIQHGFNIIDAKPNFDPSGLSILMIVERRSDSQKFVVKISRDKDLNNLPYWEFENSQKMANSKYFLKSELLEVEVQNRKTAWLLVPYFEGKSLRKHLEGDQNNRPVRWTLEEKLHIARQILQAISHLHGKNLIHRDLKPEQILINDKLEVKILDVGFAAEIGEYPKVYRFEGVEAEVLGLPSGLKGAGTFLYMDKSQREEERAHPRQDMRALNKILCELFTGQSLSGGNTRGVHQAFLDHYFEKVDYERAINSIRSLYRFPVAPENVFNVPERVAIGVFSQLTQSPDEMLALLDSAVTDDAQDFYERYGWFLSRKLGEEGRKAIRLKKFHLRGTEILYIANVSAVDVLGSLGVMENLDQMRGLSHTDRFNLILGFFYAQRESTTFQSRGRYSTIDLPSKRLHYARFRTLLNRWQNDFGYPEDKYFTEIVEKLWPEQSSQVPLTADN